MTDERKPRKNKNKGGRPSVYSPKQRAAALDLVPKIGLAKAARQLKIPKSTLGGWCKDAGVPTSTEESRAQTVAATAESILTRREQVAKTRANLVGALAEIAELGAAVETARLKTALENAGRGEMDLTRLSEVVGARTRAIHDMELLDGRATDRTEVVDSTDDIMDLQKELMERLGSG